MLAQLSAPLLGVRVSAKEVSNALQTIVPAAKAFLTRRLDDRKWMHLYVNGTNFRVRRSTVDIEPTLVVLGVDETGRKGVLSMMQGDKDRRGAWEAVFVDLNERGLDPTTVKAGIMDGLPGLGGAFREAFTQAVVLRCWVHKARNPMPRVPRRYQAAFMASWKCRCLRRTDSMAREPPSTNSDERGAKTHPTRSRASSAISRHFLLITRSLHISARTLGRLTNYKSHRASEQGIQTSFEVDGRREW